MAKPIVTRESLQQMLESSNVEYVNRVIGRALVVLFNNQTESEKKENSTVMHNGIGFTGADSKSGCLTAKYFIKHGTLLEWQRERWTRKEKSGFARLCKYHSQLNEAAKLRPPKQSDLNLQLQ